MAKNLTGAKRVRRGAASREGRRRRLDAEPLAPHLDRSSLEFPRGSSRSVRDDNQAAAPTRPAFLGGLHARPYRVLRDGRRGAPELLAALAGGHVAPAAD